MPAVPAPLRYLVLAVGLGVPLCLACLVLAHGGIATGPGIVSILLGIALGIGILAVSDWIEIERPRLRSGLIYATGASAFLLPYFLVKAIG